MNIQKLLAILFVTMFFAGCSTETYSTRYNLDFEYKGKDTKPAIWDLLDSSFKGFEITLDLKQRQHGKSSLKLMRSDTTNGSLVFFCQELPPSMVAGKEIELSGWIKTKDVQDGFANLYFISNDESYHDSSKFEDTQVKNTTDWTQISIKKKISDHATIIRIQGVLKGCGTAWFDNLELTIDGVKFQDSFIPAPKTQLSNQDKAEFRKYIYPLRAFEPDGGNTEDLKILSKLIGNSRVVALGENTHGSSEIFKMKNRLIQYLATNENFDIFSIEANMPESYRLNEYTIEGKDDPRKLIAGMYFWTWNTQEMLNMVEWMRQFNESKTRITYTGFDMQYYKGSIDILREAFKIKQQANTIVDQINAALNMTDNDKKAVGSGFDELKKQIEKSAFDNVKKAWLQQNVCLLDQYARCEQEPFLWRDRCMANNLLWIKEQNPSSKIVAWAHNMHIQKSDRMMGNWLKDSLGDDYLTFGFTFYDGSYLAVGDRGLNVYQAQPAYPGTLEYLLAQLNEPIFILDLKKIKKENSPILEWIDNLEFRSIGACKEKIEFAKYTITDKFDYLIFIWETTPSKLLKN